MQNWDLREAPERSLKEMEELKRFQGSTFDTIARRRLVEDRDTILELTAKIQELQYEVNCINDSRAFHDAESVRSGHSHVASQLALFPPFQDPGGMLSRVPDPATVPVDYDDAALEEMLHNAHREHVCHSQREDLSVGQSSSSVSE